MTSPAPPSLAVRALSAWYGEAQALHDVDLDFPAGRISVLFGRSGSGKSTVLTCLNRMIENVRGGRMRGEVLFDGKPTGGRGSALTRLRRRFGVIAQKPNPFPKSIRDNVAYGPRIHRMARDKEHLDAIVRRCLIRVGLWEEVRGDMEMHANHLSVGQQHRLCIARALAYEPEVFLIDEPLAGLDPISAASVEDLILSLRNEFTLAVVSHHLDFARRIADHVAFLEDGRVVEAGPVAQVLDSPSQPATREFLEHTDLSRNLRTRGDSAT